MSKLPSAITHFYEKIVLRRPILVILCVVCIVSFLAYKAQDFELDASAETLILEKDEDLRYSRIIELRYGEYDYLLMTFTPNSDLFSEEVLETLTRLRDDLAQLASVSSVVSILNVPLLESAAVSVKGLASNSYTLETSTVDRKRIRDEFANSLLYQNLLVSADLKTTALQINFHVSEAYKALLARSNDLREKKATHPLTAAEKAELKETTEELQRHQAHMKETRHQDIAAIRSIMEEYRNDGQLFLGGVSMVADDMISFIKSDLKTFGLGVTFFLVITLSGIFRRKRWVFLPMLCCALSAISMMGILGMFGWRVTVISSNFVSLQLIITMAITIHLIVRYRELVVANPTADQRTLILDTVRLMLTPCLYAALTTMAGFGSLIFSNILPVINFGWMMIAGIAVSLVLTFLLFPAGLMLMPQRLPKIRPRSRFSLTKLLAGFAQYHGRIILQVSAIILIVSVFGISRLQVENSFIDYFKDTTEIYKGMTVIDQKLGGTTPLDVVVQLETSSESASPAVDETNAVMDDDFSEFDEFDKPADDDKYWFTSEKMALAERIHDYLESLPETGKVLSLATVVRIAEKLNQGKPLDNFQLAVLYTEAPQKLRDILLRPYVSPEHNELRFSVRARDSDKALKRNKLLKKIRYHLTTEIGLDDEDVHLTGLLVLYNNMLQSLFDSQILTLGVVVMALMGMFLFLFRSFKVACIAIAPNLLAIGTVLGVMGWLNIPLDMMTITIAAISVGIGVDNTIHYIYRFRQEIATDHNYTQSMHRCHASIGRALYYTSLTIIIGFSILAASNFIPTICFGLLTGLAMSMALIACLTLLPELLVVFKPFGPPASRE